jgi:hypothetical protein
MALSLVNEASASYWRIVKSSWKLFIKATSGTVKSSVGIGRLVKTSGTQRWRTGKRTRIACESSTRS